MKKNATIWPMGFKMLLLSIFATVATSVSAQEQVVCGTDENQLALERLHPELIKLREQMEKNAITARSNVDNGQVVIIPVVFHIIHENGPEKISVKVIQDQIATLNECYRLKNTDIALIRNSFKDLATDARIEFRLATKDPWGNCSNGVTYDASAQTNNATNQAKSLNWWDNSRYLNIWVVKSISQANLQGILAGFAQFPWDSKILSSTDGVMMNYQYVGKNQRTLVHEIGHYLGLYHTFQDGCSSDQKLEGDHVEDTPPVAVANFGRPVNLNSCSTDIPDMPDMTENYMDYTDTKYMFSKGQVDRMRMYLFSSARNNLWATDNLNKVLYSCTSGISREEQNNVNVDLFPNPSSGNFSLIINLDKAQSFQYEIMDIAGKQVYISQPTTIANGANTFNLQCNSLNIYKAGIYIIKISCGANVLTRKLVVNP